MADHYKLGTRSAGKRRRRLIRLTAAAGLLVALVFVGMHSTVAVKHALEPRTSIKQSAAATTKIAYDKKTVTYSQPDFTVELPATWKPVPRPAGPYQTYSWSTSDSGTDGQEITVYQDTIPVNFAVNRALVVEGQVDHLQVTGTVSDNCTTFTSSLHGSGQAGVPAKWQGISFLCDRANATRDTVGTSSADGVNTVLLKNSSTGMTHKYFFTYTNHSINADYSVFYDMLRNLKMK